jgi:Uma2 family endonuclease
MALVVRPVLTPDEFLAWEREQSERHHYVGGQVFAMAGGSVRHNALGARAIVLIGGRVADGACRVCTSDQRIGLPDEEFVYAVVVCAPVIVRPAATDVLTNPVVFVEVLSKGTEAYDRGAKQNELPGEA